MKLIPNVDQLIINKRVATLTQLPLTAVHIAVPHLHGRPKLPLQTTMAYLALINATAGGKLVWVCGGVCGYGVGRVLHVVTATNVPAIHTLWTPRANLTVRRKLGIRSFSLKEQRFVFAPSITPMPHPSTFSSSSSSETCMITRHVRGVMELRQSILNDKAFCR